MTDVDPLRSNPEETRRKLLEAGMAILEEQPAGNVMSHIKAPVVSARAGLTPGAFYYHWPKQQNFVQDLLDFVMQPEHSRPVNELFARLGATVGDAVGLRDLIMDTARANLNSISKSSRFAVQMAIWARQANDPHARELLKKLYDEFEADLSVAYQRLIDSSGLQLKAPMTIAKLTTIVTGLGEGLAIHRAVDPDGVDEDLFGIGVLALLPSLLEPKDTATAK